MAFFGGLHIKTYDYFFAPRSRSKFTTSTGNLCGNSVPTFCNIHAVSQWTTKAASSSSSAKSCASSSLIKPVMSSTSSAAPSIWSFPMEWWSTTDKRSSSPTTGRTASRCSTTRAFTSAKLVEKVRNLFFCCCFELPKSGHSTADSYQNSGHFVNKITLILGLHGVYDFQVYRKYSKI